MLERIFAMLRELYQVEFDGNLRDFILPQSENSAQQEELVVVEFPEQNYELGLKLNPQLEEIIQHQPFQHIHELSLVIEGLSHFTHVLDRIARERSTSLLEMELQAEVDKFIILHFLAWEELHEFPPALFRAQFEEHHFSEHLNGNELKRYQNAHQLAAKFCYHLRERYLYPLKLRGLVQSARNFFSQDFQAKVKPLVA